VLPAGCRQEVLFAGRYYLLLENLPVQFSAFVPIKRKEIVLTFSDKAFFSLLAIAEMPSPFAKTL
jgi:hypothetical protein